jgi:hypothetical protein
MSECPYKKTQSNIAQFNKDAEKIIKKTTDELNPQKDYKKCPYSNQTPTNDSKIPEKEVKEEKEDSDDDQPKGGCPVMNRGIKLNLIPYS